MVAAAVGDRPDGRLGDTLFDVATLAAYSPDPLTSARTLTRELDIPAVALDGWLAVNLYIAAESLRERGLDNARHLDALRRVLPAG